jgi:hypothetical protein
MLFNGNLFSLPILIEVPERGKSLGLTVTPSRSVVGFVNDANQALTVIGTAAFLPAIGKLHTAERRLEKWRLRPFACGDLARWFSARRFLVPIPRRSSIRIRRDDSHTYHEKKGDGSSFHQLDHWRCAVVIFTAISTCYYVKLWPAATIARRRTQQHHEIGCDASKNLQ